MYTLPHPQLSTFLVDQAGFTSCTVSPLLTFFFHVVNLDAVVFENDNFSGEDLNSSFFGVHKFIKLLMSA
jgi:hypothetical protein